MEEHEEQQNPMPFYQQQTADDTLGSLQYQLDNADIVADIMHILKKEVMKLHADGSVTYERQEGVKPLINDTGLGNIISTMKTRLTKIMILSDLDQITIQRIVSDIHEDLTDDFYYNWEAYQIKDLATASLIISIVTDTVYASLRKGHMGNYMKLLRSMHSIQEIQQANFRPQVRGERGGGGMSDRIGNLLFRKRR